MSKPRATPPLTQAFHQAFSWLPLNQRTDPHAQFYALTKDVCQGIQTCVDVAHFSIMDRDTDATPTLNITDTERLLRLALTSSQMLAEIATTRIDRLNDGGCNEVM